MKSPSGHECSVRLILPLVRSLSSAGVDPAALFGAEGIEVAPGLAADLDPEQRVSHELIAALLQRAVATTSGSRSTNGSLGLSLAEHVALDDFDVLVYLAISCDTVGDTMRSVARYLPLMHSAMEMRLVPGPLGETVHLDLAPGYTPIPIGIEFVFAVIIRIGRQMADADFRPVRVELSHSPAPSQHAVYERFFRAPVRFGASANAMTFSKETWSLRQARADAKLHSVLARQAEKWVRDLPDSGTFSTRVAEAIAAELSGGNAYAHHVALLLGVSERTLHRRLRDESTSFGEIIDRLRHRLALRHLETRSLPIAEIALLLGYNHVSAFHRAFRRWEAKTPADFRREVWARQGITRPPLGP